MMDLIVQFAVLLGIAAWIPGLSASSEDWRGARFLFAFLALPIGLYVGNVLLGVPLRVLFWILAAAALAGLVRAFWAARQGKPWAAAFKRLAHPIWVFPFFLFVIVAVAGGLYYQPYLGDEFTSWLRISRQIFLADAYWSERIDYQYGSYTNGWPLLVVLPSLPFGDFSESRAAAMQFFMHVGLMGLTFDVLRYLARDGGGVAKTAGELFAWTGVLVLLAAEASWLLLPTDLLIERPVLYALLVVFVLGLAGQYEGFDRPRLALFLGVAWTAGYLMKVSALAVGPAVGLFWLTFLWRDVKTGGRPGWSRVFWLAAAMLAPLLVAFITWGQIRPADSCQASFTVLFKDGLGGFIGPPALGLIGRMGDAAFNYMAVFKPSLTILSVAALLGVLFSRRLFILPAGFAAFALFYVFALFTAYVSCYGALESTYLDSYTRFIRTPIRMLHFLGLLALFGGVAGLAPGVNRLRRSWAGGLVNRRWFFPCALVIICIGLAWQAFNLNRSVTDMASRHDQDAMNIALVIKVRDQARQLKRILARRGMDGARISMIEQGGYDVAANVANYYGLKRRRGGTYTHYAVAGPYNWATAPGKFSTRVVTEAKLVEWWRKFDVVWPVRTDSWVRGILATLIDDPGCQKDPEAYFLFGTGKGRFECVAKNRTRSEIK